MNTVGCKYEVALMDIHKYNNLITFHRCTTGTEMNLLYLLLISTMEVKVLETPVSGLSTLHCSSTVLSRPSGVQDNVLPLTVRPRKDQV